MPEDRFIKAYHEFREEVDVTRGGVLPEVDDLVHYMLLGVPRVPADDEPGDDAKLEAIDQRVSILKALFIEINGDHPESFLDEGLRRYDLASEEARSLLQESDEEMRKAESGKRNDD